MKLLLTASLLFAFSGLLAQEKYSVYFEHDSFNLDPKNESDLILWLKSFSDTLSKIELVGFTDHLGSESHNQMLSEKRVETVLRLIEVEQPVPYRMSFTDARGETEAEQFQDGSRNPSDRRVDVFATIPKAHQTRVETLEPEPTEVDSKEENSDSDLLVKAEVGQTIVLRNLNFFPGRHYLIPQALPELERLAHILKENPNMEIEIQGHICCKLDSLDGLDVDTRTYQLSFNRSEYIFNQLVLAGISPERMKYRGFAGSRPLVKPEMTETDRQRNRRVGIRILKK